MTREEAIEKLKISKSYFSEMPEFHHDREIVKFALEGNGGYNLKYLDDDLKNDKELVMIALKSDPAYIRFVPEELISDPEIQELYENYKNKVAKMEREKIEKEMEEEEQRRFDQLNQLKYEIEETISKAKFISEQLNISTTDALLALQILEIKNANTEIEGFNSDIEDLRVEIEEIREEIDNFDL